MISLYTAHIFLSIYSYALFNGSMHMYVYSLCYYKVGMHVNGHIHIILLSFCASIHLDHHVYTVTH